MGVPLWQESFLAKTTGVIATYKDDIGASAANTNVVINFGAGTGAGTLVVEEAHDAAFAGTWAVLATLTWAAASSVKVALITGPWKALRLRFTSDVTGGTADIYVQANK